MLTQRFAQGLAMAIEAHDQQYRKGTSIPYVSHPMAVASIALEYGADEDQAIAALLHDVVEDAGAIFIERIQSSFGDRVLNIVMGCTDGIADNNGKKAEWMQRKASYIEHLKNASDDVILVSGADKLHNARAIVSDIECIGELVFKRFSATKQQTLWYYQSLSQMFKLRNAPMHQALTRAVEQMHQLCEA
jgi:(p)ppGpp synthase/HD superfamily hydrolase